MTQAVLNLRSYPRDEESHSHPFVQVLLPLAGDMELEVEGSSDLVGAGQGAIVPPDARHAFRGLGENRFAILDVFESDTAGPPRLADAGRARAFFTLGPGLYHLTGFLVRSPLGPASEALDAHAAPLLLAVLDSELTGGSADLPARLERALAFLRRNYAQPIGSADAAAAASLSPSRFHALFRRWLNQTPQAYLTALRIARARELLAESDLPIAQIALLVGYGDQTALSRAFRRETGTTPARYRRARRCPRLGLREEETRPQEREERSRQALKTRSV